MYHIALDHPGPVIRINRPKQIAALADRFEDSPLYTYKKCRFLHLSFVTMELVIQK